MRAVVSSFVSLVLIIASSEAAAISSTFDANAEGWTAQSRNFFSDFALGGTSSPTHHASGGNPGGYISISDPSGLSDFFSAPASYLGNQSGAIGTTLSFDLYSDNATVMNAPFLALLISGSSILVFDSTGTIGPSWASIGVPLEPATGWKVVAAGCLATSTCTAAVASDFAAVMSNLTSLNIRGDWTAGSDTGRLDNVNMVPEPTTLLLLLAGLSGLAWYSKRTGVS